MKVRKSALAAVAGVLLALLPAPQAHAETVIRPDAQGDAPAAIDVHSAAYTHARRQVRVVADIPDLGGRGFAALSISRFTIFEAGYVVQIRKRAGAEPRVRLFYFDHFGLEPRPCGAVSGRWGEDQVRLAVARHCLDGHIRNRLFVQFGIQRGADFDRAPAVRRLQRG